MATVEFNLVGLADHDQEKIDDVVLHELIHILVNEMREGEIHHEERVVTQLTKAFKWTIRKGMEDGRVS